MINRISTYQYYQDGLNGILKNQSLMNEAMQEITSGKKQLDPYDKAQVEVNTVNISRQAQMLRNNVWLNHSLEVQESALENAQNYILSIKELSVKTVNSSIESQQPFRQEAQVLRDGLLSALNAKNENGEYIFSGFSNTTIPFDNNGKYVATGSSRTINIAENVSVKFSLDEQDFSSGEIEKMIQQMDLFISGSSTTLAPASSSIDSALNKISFSRTQIGLTMNQADSWKESVQNLQDQSTALISQLEDIDYASSITKLNQAKNAYEASLKTMALMNTTNLFSYINP